VANLRDILYGVSMVSVHGRTDIHVANIIADSRKVDLEDVFVAIKGELSDGHQYIKKAIELGASAIVCEELPQQLDAAVTYVQVKNARTAIAIMATNFYDHPSKNVKLVGITGTNGKTTTATMLYRLFTELGYPCGLISTIENKIGKTILPSTHTTPDPVSINALLHDMVVAGCEYVFMEVSSHAIHQHRIKGLHFEGGVFTNITRDHLDYHKDFKEYINVKKAFFDDLPKSAFALVNVDDKNGEVMLQNTKAKKKTFAIKTMADYKVKILENTFAGLVLEVNGIELFSRMVGKFNAYNILTVYAVADLLGQDMGEVLTALSTLSGAEGRFEYIISSKDGIIGIVDYAHTPDALQNVLQTIQEIRTGTESVITLVGCGGDRDKGKRPIMATIAAEFSDKVILTSDNPRSEIPAQIIQEMKAGVPPHLTKKLMVVEDRKEAIRVACSLANSKDILMLAGKGHEKYQEINGKRFPFDDKQILADTFKELER
jgi:UDP-N-acetylmuramoyl-L-alanyl-D-glutamate--2,6-diaminopimelate ligase